MIFVLSFLAYLKTFGSGLKFIAFWTIFYISHKTSSLKYYVNLKKKYFNNFVISENLFYGFEARGKNCCCFWRGCWESFF